MSVQHAHPPENVQMRATLTLHDPQVRLACPSCQPGISKLVGKAHVSIERTFWVRSSIARKATCTRVRAAETVLSSTECSVSTVRVVHSSTGRFSFPISLMLPFACSNLYALTLSKIPYPICKIGKINVRLFDF